jgi:M6 family metalloprotease-like protein
MRRILQVAAACGVTLASSQALALEHWMGQQRALVLMIRWSNATPAHTVEEMRDTFFGETGSLRDFFLENSAGKFDLTGDVLDWRDANQRWNAANGCKLDPIVAAAWRAFGGDVDIADYDSDHDGKIDNLFVIHSGRIDQDRVGPECTFTDFDQANHTAVFQTAGLGSVGEAIPIGFYIHESGHQFFGFPDLYSDHYHGKYGVAMWGMMGLGAWGTYNQTPKADLFRFPSHFEPLSKVTIGWTKPRVVNTTQHVVLQPVEGTAEVVSIPARAGTNYYLEYRSERGFSKPHLGHGLMIWKNYTLVQADGRDDLDHGRNLGFRPLPPIDENFGDATDPFPGDGHVTSYADRGAGFTISGIVRADDRVEFDVTFAKGEPQPYTMPVVPRFDGVERL